jgi:hypothetical protein
MCNLCTLQVVTLIGDSEIEHNIIRHYLCVLLAAYKAQGAPRLRTEYLTEDGNKEITLRPSWQVVIDNALSEDFDEHIFKLIQVCHDMDQENTDAKLRRLYMTAASVALDCPLVFE